MPGWAAKAARGLDAWKFYDERGGGEEMLTESIVRIGKPIVCSDLPIRERIRWLTDVNSDNCKNFFQNVFLIELGNGKDALHRLKIGNNMKTNKKEVFVVDEVWNTSFPVLYPSGRNPLNAQGIYP
ncbi:MAG: hypothetical protein GX114_04955, partial [Clostridiales bacterium]|nr:hypothetical protein [Clostridiales bacterium]